MTVTLPIQPRTKNTLLSKSNEEIAGVVYGPKMAATAVVVNRKEFERTFKIAGESTIIELQGLDAPIDVLVKEVTFAPIKGGIVHIDFYALEKGKEITTDVPLTFINEAPAVKAGAVVSKVMHEIAIVCKPNDLPSHIDVDLSLLVQAEDKIHVSDIVAPKGVKITTDANDVVALAEAIKEEVEVEAPIVAAADVPAEKKGKTEEEAAS